MTPVVRPGAVVAIARAARWATMRQSWQRPPDTVPVVMGSVSVATTTLTVMPRLSLSGIRFSGLGQAVDHPGRPSGNVRV
ncbi:hypothetical protein [Streptomyces canus]|uniref:hypothetical protein n=1 Tax=Streptomyces canus TaxID=58343 RepID=UPI0032475788